MVSRLEKQIKGLKDSLSLIENQLSSIDYTEDNEECQNLLQLQADMVELLQLNEEELLEQKRTELLSLCEDLEQKTTDPASSPSSSPALTSIYNFSIGQSCRIPHWSSRGVFHLQNAIISEWDEANEKVRVMLCNPTRLSDIPCDKWFSEESCEEGVACHYSHGIVVDAADVMAYTLPDFDNIGQGSTCLVQLKEMVSQSNPLLAQLWHHAMVEFVDPNTQTCVVKLRHPNRLMNVDFCHIFPLDTPLEEDGDEASSSSDDDVEDGNDAADMEAPVMFFDNDSIQTTECLGAWEKHTTGIGSKLMAKMGYITGQGLGSEGQGRALPVPIELLPPGRSLDEIMRLREEAAAGSSSQASNKSIFNPFNRKAYKRLSTTAPAGKAKAPLLREKKSKTVFSFLNTQLNQPEKNFPSQQRPLHTSLSHKDLKEIDQQTLNQQMFHIHEKITKVKAHVERLRLCSHQSATSQRLAGLEKELSHLMEEDKKLRKVNSDRKSRRDLCVF